MENIKNNRPTIFIVLISLTLFILFGIYLMYISILNNNEDNTNFIDSSSEQSQITSTQPTNTPTVAPTLVITEEKIINYEIVYQLDNIRYDGGKSYYVLIDSVNLENDKFKDDIKSVVSDIVQKYGNKINIEFIDDRSVLDLYYKSHYGKNTLNRILTSDEVKSLEIHMIASYTGELKTVPPEYELSFFPSSFSSHPLIGKYRDSIEYDPD